MDKATTHKLQAYQLTVIFSVLFALLGFSYNVWRMEVSEENNNIRTACFEILLELAALEQLVYAAHYDNDPIEGNPRKGWVKVGLIADLSTLTTNSVTGKTDDLKKTWALRWETMPKNKMSLDQIVSAIDAVRAEIKKVLRALD